MVNNLQSKKTTHMDPYEQTHTLKHRHFNRICMARLAISASCSVCMCVLRRAAAPLSSCHVTAVQHCGSTEERSRSLFKLFGCIMGFLSMVTVHRHRHGETAEMRLFPHVHVIVIQNKFLPQCFRNKRGRIFLPQ